MEICKIWTTEISTQTIFIIMSNKGRLPASGLGAKRPHRNQQNNESPFQVGIKLPVEVLLNTAVDFGFKKYCAGLRKLMSTFGH